MHAFRASSNTNKPDKTTW